MGKKRMVYKPAGGRSKLTIETMKYFVSGIRNAWKQGRMGKEYVGYRVCGKVYEDCQTDFLICASYVGLAITYIERKEEVKVPVYLVRQLIDFIDADNKLTKYRRQLHVRHELILEECFRRLGYTAKVTVDLGQERIFVHNVAKVVGRDEIKMDGDYILFNLKGESKEGFSVRLLKTIEF